MGLERNKMPDRNWMIICIGTLDPMHKIFDKAYKPVIKPRQAKFEPVFDNSDGFFDNLPERRGCNDRGGPRFTFSSRQQRLDFAIKKEEERAARTSKKIESLKLQKS